VILVIDLILFLLTMQLLYIYLEEYRNFKRQGFSFTKEYNISFKEAEEKIIFNIEENPNHIVDFFDNESILDVTAIIGENGSGKSNIIEDADTIPTEFEKFWSEEQRKAFVNLVGEENLEEEKTQKLIEDYLFAERPPRKDRSLSPYQRSTAFGTTPRNHKRTYLRQSHEIR
jgi:hypothetical protein